MGRLIITMLMVLIILASGSGIGSAANTVDSFAINGKAVQANFSANVTKGYAPLSVQFTDTSKNAGSLSWDFENDGIIDSTDSNPVHEYAAGNYTVNLTARDNSKKNTNSCFGNVTVLQSTPTILWSNPADITNGTALSSTQLNAEASVPGTFTYNPAEGTVLGVGTQTLHVDFTPTDTANYTSATADVIINVSENPEPVLPIANFTASPISGSAPLSVQFTDLSENATSVNWDFENDRGIDSTERNPIHKFTTAGTYTVNLTVINENGTDSKSTTIEVTKKPIHWAFSPQEPISGDILNIDGSASPEEKVDALVTFNKTVPVSEGKFEYVLEGVKIPEGFNNLFTVEAEGAKNLNVRVKLLLWVTKSSEASGDTAIVSQSNVPPGTYTIKIDGDARDVPEVNLKIIASQGIQADSNGNFSYSYNTTAVPLGNFEVKIGDIAKEITLRPDEELNNPIHWAFSPQEPVCGDTLYINGSASPEKKANVSVTFNKNVPVSEEGKYEYTLENVTVPEGLDNLYSVEASGVNNLNVRVKMVLWVTKSSEASGNTAIISQSNVPPGTYKIKINGDAREGVSEVNLKITAFQGIQADSNGNFSYSYDTAAVPPGNFEVKVGDITKEITLRPEGTEEPSLVLPVANFSSDVTGGHAPLTVQFTDLSENAASVSWDFGDKKTSTERNPVHKFTTAGTYTVNLTAINGNGTDSNSSIINVTKKPIYWEFSPQEPVSGDLLNVDGSASPGEKVDVFATFEKTVPISGGKFEYNLKDVEIPEGLDNLFTVEASGVNNLNVRVKMVVWVTKSSKASGNTAIVSQSNVPPGTYKIKIDGNAEEGVSDVNLKITASQKIKADSNGNFSYSYDTAAVPPGNFEVKVGDFTKEITLRPQETEEPSLVLPVANFSSDVTAGYIPLTVQFTDLSENAASVSWDFGDKKTSTERNPIYKFTTAGTYTVNLTAINGNGTDSKSATIEVTKKPIPGHTKLPTDPDNDGRYEDVNGNGMLDFNDVVVFYSNMNWIKGNVPVGLFDYNNNGFIDFNDIVMLYKKVK